MGKSLTYADVEEASRALAAWLQNLGLKRGARVAIMMPNVLQYPVAIAAILRAGCTVVNVNPLYKPRELEFQLTDAGAEAIIVLENFASVLQQALPNLQVKHVVIASLGDMLGTVKGTIVNAVVRYVKKMVPAYSIPGAMKFNDAVAAGRTMALEASASSPTTSHFSNTQAAPRAWRKARCFSIATWSPTCCRSRRGTSRWSISRRESTT